MRQKKVVIYQSKYYFLVIVFISFQSFIVAQTDEFRIGVASKIINPELGSLVQAATKVTRATEIKGDLEANGLYLSKGEFQLLMVSCDLGGLESPFVIEVREAMGVASGIPPRNIIITCTHARGPSLLKTNYLMPLDTVYMNRLKVWLIDLAKEAVESAQPGRIGWAKDELALGYNRRLTWADGKHTMFGNPNRSDFNGLEGPNDHQHTVIFAEDLKGDLISILYNNTSHIPIYYGSGIFSSELPGEVRKTIRNLGHENLPVLFINGAQGDISLGDQLNPISETKEEKMKRYTKLVVEKTMDLYDEATFYSDPLLKHLHHDLKVGVRLPSTEQLIEGRKVLKKIDDGENIRGMEMIMAFGPVYLQEKYGNSPFETIPIHAIRIEDLALVSQPCELYSQFGLDIKQRSPFAGTAVLGLADGYVGYCPTIYGVLGGGYTGAPIAWTRLEPYAGYKIVESASKLLYSLWITD